MCACSKCVCVGGGGGSRGVCPFTLFGHGWACHCVLGVGRHTLLTNMFTLLHVMITYSTERLCAGRDRGILGQSV